MGHEHSHRRTLGERRGRTGAILSRGGVKDVLSKTSPITPTLFTSQQCWVMPIHLFKRRSHSLIGNLHTLLYLRLVALYCLQHPVGLTDFLGVTLSTSPYLDLVRASFLDLTLVPRPLPPVLVAGVVRGGGGCARSTAVPRGQLPPDVD